MAFSLGMSKIDGEGSKPGSVGSAGAKVQRETRSEMKELARDAGGGNERDEAAPFKPTRAAITLSNDI